MAATLKKNNVRFLLWKAHVFLSICIAVKIAHTDTIASISNEAQTTGAIKRSLSVNTVSVHRAIVAAIQTALVDI